MNKIIVPTDFSSCAQKAADVGAVIAQRTNGVVVLFNAYHIANPGRTVMIDISDIIKKESQEGLQKEKERLEKFGVRVEVESAYGLAVDLTKHLAEKLSADLIVMGTHGASGLKGKLFGSVTSGMVGSSACPVLAIPEDCDIMSFRKLVFAWDLEEISQAHIYPIKSLTSSLGLELDLVHVSMDESKGTDALLLQETAEKIGATEFHEIIGEEVDKTLEEYSSQNNALLAVVARKHGLLHKFFIKSHSKSIANHARQPMLFVA